MLSTSTRALISAVAVILALTAGPIAAQDAAPSPGKEEMGMVKLEVRSPAFAEGDTIPGKYTCTGANVSPPLSWSKPPDKTRSLALICEDPDAPVGLWVHWVIWALPADSTSLPEGVPQQTHLPNKARQGKNDFKKIGYGGPCPPPGKPHRYFFKLYALDFVPDLEAGSTRKDLLKAIEGHVVAEGQLMGRFAR